MTDRTAPPIFATDRQGRPYLRVSLTAAGGNRIHRWAVCTSRNRKTVIGTINAYAALAKDGTPLRELILAAPGEIEERPARYNSKYGRFELAEESEVGQDGR